MSNPANRDFEIATPPSRDTRETGVHPLVIELAIGATLWFVAVIWLAFARGVETDFALAIVTLFFAFFFGLFLLTASYGRHDPRWELPRRSFRRFLVSQVRTATGTMSGRDLMIEITMLPLALALAATLIGIVWMAVG
jgi:hypothetical protein